MVGLNCWPQRHLLLRGDTYFRGVPTLELLFSASTKVKSTLEDTGNTYRMYKILSKMCMPNLCIYLINFSEEKQFLLRKIHVWMAF